ncbi:hypothetical protein KKD70_05235 [Patescibacteria group bacterium]|nr:hypothetical protein [Patescibacteria group bacterium]
MGKKEDRGIDVNFSGEDSPIDGIISGTIDMPKDVDDLILMDDGIPDGWVSIEINDDPDDLLQHISEGALSILNENDNDEVGAFSAEDGAFLELDEEDLVEINEPIRNRMPTMRLKAIDAEVLPQKEKPISGLHDAFYMKDVKREGLYVLKEKKGLLYGGKKYVDDYLNAIRDGAGINKEHNIMHFKDDLYAILALLNNIPYIALRPTELNAKKGSYTIEFTRLKAGINSLGFQGFEDKVNDILKKFEYIKLKEILPENDQVASEIEFLVRQNKGKYTEETIEFLNNALKKEYNERIRKIHPGIKFDFDIALDFSKSIVCVEGIDHDKEKLFELEFVYQGLNQEYFAERVRKFKDQLFMYFWDYRLQKK